MTWTYAALAQALAAAALESLPDADAAAALAAATVQRHRDVPTAEARRILQRSGEWGAVTILSRRSPASAEEEQAVAIAITALSALSPGGWETLRMTVPEDRAAVVGMLDGLAAVGAVSPETRAALLALEYEDVPAWVPAPTEHDVAHARTL